MQKPHLSYWQSVWKQFLKRPLGVLALGVVFLFAIVGIYAPLLASSKPLAVRFEGQWFFPLFRYLFYTGFFSKPLDLFYNLLMVTLPLFILFAVFLKNRRIYRFWCLVIIVLLQFVFFTYLILSPLKNPSLSPKLNEYKKILLKNHREENKISPMQVYPQIDWGTQLKLMEPYARLNLVLRYRLYLIQHEHLSPYRQRYEDKARERRQADVLFPTLWNLTYGKNTPALVQRDHWLREQALKLNDIVMPLIRPFHWEDDAGGDQSLNQFVSWWDLTRINRKDMVASLIFGIRISLSVGLLGVGLALLIGIPIGALSGYYGGKIDLTACRLIEVWESMPIFFMLLMIVSFLQSKSIFLVISVIGLFGWTSFSRFVRGEFLRQKQLLYVEACRAMGYNDKIIIFSHLLPNALPPLLTLIPFAIMGAITSEAGLSFLGLGEEGSNSWGVLMDEGRTAFPSESDLLWPPAILLTLLLVSIALVGDSLRDALDPRMRKH